jgi:hypothetical protein
VGLLRNDALIKHPGIRKRPTTDAEWKIFLDSLNDQSIVPVTLSGNSDTNIAVGSLLGSEDITVNGGQADAWQELRTFTTDFEGTFRLYVEVQMVQTLGSDSTAVGWRLVNGSGSVVHTENVSATSYGDTFSGEETVTVTGETWSIEGRTLSNLSTWINDTQIRDTEVRASLGYATFT